MATFTKVENRPFVASKGDYFVATRRKNGSIVSPGTVFHPLGKDEVIVLNYSRREVMEGRVTIGGRAALAHLRDSLIEICKLRNID